MAARATWVVVGTEAEAEAQAQVESEAEANLEERKGEAEVGNKTFE